jgi:hypothetical protein
MQRAKAEGSAGTVWAMCVIVPLVCVAVCDTINRFLLASIFLIVTAVQALKTAPFSVTSMLEGVNFSAVRARSTFKHLLVVFSVCTLLLLTLRSSFAGGIHMILDESFYMNAKNLR